MVACMERLPYQEEGVLYMITLATGSEVLSKPWELLNRRSGSLGPNSRSPTSMRERNPLLSSRGRLNDGMHLDHQRSFSKEQAYKLDKRVSRVE